MKKVLAIILAVGLVAIGFSFDVSAQQGALVTVAPTPSVSVQVAGAAATPAVNTQNTITLTPPAGQYVYILGMEWQACQNGIGTANVNSTFTTTGLASSLPSEEYSLAASANICASGTWPSLSIPLKSKTAGVAVTFVSPAAATNTAYGQNVFYYFAP